MARSSEEEQKRRRRKRLVQGLVLGSAAVGLPALANALVARKSRSLEEPAWGRRHRYAWTYGEVAFQRLGEGEPIVLVHSLGPGHDSEEWRQAAEILARGRRVFALDLLGWGTSDKPSMPYDDELYIQLLTDFLSDVVRDRAVLAAAGLPAAWAVQVAVDRPELLRGLALITPSGADLYGDEPDLRDALVHRLLRLPMLGTSALNVYTSRGAIVQHLEREICNPDRIDAALVDHHHRSARQPGSHSALAAYLCGYLNHPVEELLQRLDVPVMLAWGRRSVTPPVESADLWLRHLPEARLEVFEACGALPHLEVPERLCRRLAEFETELPE